MSKKPHQPQNNPSLQIRAQQVSRTFSGPLPQPQDLQHYEEVLPGLAREIIDMAKKEAAHRHEIEVGVMAQNTMAIEIEGSKGKTIRNGQWMGFTLGIGILGVGTAAIFNGYGLEGVAMIGFEIAGIITALIWGKRKIG